MTCEGIAIAPVFGYATTHELRCMTCGRGVVIKYRKAAWPLVWWYAHLPS